MESFEELTLLREAGIIGWREFIRRQPEVEEEYFAWCLTNDLDMNEETAEAYMTYIEECIFKG